VIAVAGRPVHTAVIDWDGTAVPGGQWPEKPMEFMPGFVEAMRRLHEEGIRLVIMSSRLNPHDPYTGQRTQQYESMAAGNYQYMRGLLDAHGLTFVAVWHKEGKPSGMVYVDDKAERYSGRKNAWAAMADRILLRAGKEDAVFPAYEMENV
jgi:hypothetical protein